MMRYLSIILLYLAILNDCYAVLAMPEPQELLKDPCERNNILRFTYRLRRFFDPNIITGDPVIDAKIVELRKNPTKEAKFEFALYIQDRLKNMTPPIQSIVIGGDIYIAPKEGNLRGEHWLTRMATSLSKPTKNRPTTYNLAFFVDKALTRGNLYNRYEKTIGIDWADFFAIYAGPVTIHEIGHAMTANEASHPFDRRIKRSQSTIFPDAEIMPEESLLSSASPRIKDNYSPEFAVDEANRYADESTHLLAIAKRYKDDPEILNNITTVAKEELDIAREFAQICLTSLNRMYNAFFFAKNERILAAEIQTTSSAGYFDYKVSVVNPVTGKTNTLTFHSRQVASNNKLSIQEIQKFVEDLRYLYIRLMKGIIEKEERLKKEQAALEQQLPIFSLTSFKDPVFVSGIPYQIINVLSVDNGKINPQRGTHDPFLFEAVDTKTREKVFIKASDKEEVIKTINNEAERTKLVFPQRLVDHIENRVTGIYDGKYAVLVTRQVPGASLEKLIEFMRFDPSRPNDATLLRQIAYEFFRDLAHIHSLGIVHGDLKPGNVLAEYSENEHSLNLKSLNIIDLGFAFIPEEPIKGQALYRCKDWPFRRGNNIFQVGTRQYATPEMDTHTGGYPRDYQTLALTLIELVSDKYESTRHNIRGKPLLEEPEKEKLRKYCPDIYELIMAGMEPDPKTRMIKYYEWGVKYKQIP